MTFEIVGHRGAMGLEPENTLRSFRRAEKDGADVVELDLRLSSDGQLVILHDHDVGRTTDGEGEVSAMTLAEIKALDAGRGETIPTFDEALDAIDLPIQAEIKSAEAARAVIDTIRRRDLLDRVIVTSFQGPIVAVAAAELPGVRTGLIFSGAPPESPERARAVGATVVCLGISEVNAEVVESCHSQHIDVFAWLANDADQLQHALRAGVDGVTTDYPNLLRDSMRELSEVRDLLATRDRGA